MDDDFSTDNNISLDRAISNYLFAVKLSRSENTTRTYKNALNFFAFVIKNQEIDPKHFPVRELSEDSMVWMITEMRTYAPTSESLYISAVSGFFEYIAAEKLADVNLPRLRLLIKQRARKTGKRLPQFHRESIEEILSYAKHLINIHYDDNNIRLRAYRDRAFLITLADTGLRVSEACSLRRGDIDWNESKAIIIGKGDKQAVIRFSSRSIQALRDYISARNIQDGASGKPLQSLPLFARHDKGAGKKIKTISTTTGRNIVKHRVKEALGPDAIGQITPHSFRHYFVTTVLRASGNLKLAQELARHTNISVTQRYAHLSDDEIDRNYHEILI